MIRSGQMVNENPTQDFTIFAPQSSDGNDISKIYPSNDQSTNNPIFYHVVKGRFYASKLRNNQELESVYRNEKLKVTKYSFGVSWKIHLTSFEKKYNLGRLHWMCRINQSRSWMQKQCGSFYKKSKFSNDPFFLYIKTIAISCTNRYRY